MLESLLKNWRDLLNMKNLEKKAHAYALKNAIAYKGKAQIGSVLSALFHEGLKKEDVKKFIIDINKIVSEVNKLSLKEQEKEFEKLKKEVDEREEREGLPELPNANKGVVMRFAPSPSGPLHIGHAATGSISALYVKKYGGLYYVRIEDTNPENIYLKAYKMIEEESKWLWGKKTKIIIQSDRMKLYYKYAEKLIKKKSAYVCTCSAEKFKEFAELKETCPCRNNELKENLYRWKKMLDKGGYGEGDAVLRFKSDMKHPNPAMRDFPLARINESKHPRQRKKYRVWPLMNLAVTVDDMEMKISHAIRAREHRDNAERQKMIFKVLGKKYPWTAFLGRYIFTDLAISATKMRQAIEKGEYSGWDDPGLPTIAALKKKGYKPYSFWGISVRSGLSGSDKILDKKQYFELLDYFNKHPEEVIL